MIKGKNHPTTTAQNNSNMNPSSNKSDFLSMLGNSPFITMCLENTFDITLISMNYKYNYGYEINSACRTFIFTPSSQRIFINILAAFSSSMGACLRGKTETGKKETVRTLS